MKRALIGVLAAALAGCVTLDNRVACTAAKDKAFFVSEYGRIGVASQLSDKDREVVCK
jgi:hypothetical protein